MQMLGSETPFDDGSKFEPITDHRIGDPSANRARDRVVLR